MKKWINKELIYLSLIILLIVCGTVVGFTHATGYINNTQHESFLSESVVSYKLIVNYDGINADGRDSTTDYIDHMDSNYFFVEDTVPEGLIFEGFNEVNEAYIYGRNRIDNSICGSVSYHSNNYTPDTYHYKGLTYNEESRKISFYASFPTAGCTLEIGYHVRMPSIDDPTTPQIELRRDFYNHFKVYRDNDIIVSNYAHVYEEEQNAPNIHNVHYVYTGDVPSDAPDIPGDEGYSAGSIAEVLENPQIYGYEFDGWTSSDVEISSNGKYTMPDRDITIYGNFTKKETHKVTCIFDGYVPKGAVPPQEQYFVVGDEIEMGFVFPIDNKVYYDGYSFKEWTSNDVEIQEITEGDGFVRRTFTMPDHDVVLIGTFAKKTVHIYIYYEPDLPSDLENTLPKDITYECGEEPPDLPDSLSDPLGRFFFQNWIEEHNVATRSGGTRTLHGYNGYSYDAMCEDRRIRGEWVPKIAETDIEVFKTITNDKGGFHAGETINYEIKVKTGNTAADDIFLEESLDGITYTPASNYVLEDDHLIRIPHMDAYSTLKIYASMTMPNNNENTITNTVRRIGATIPDDMHLSDKNKEASATVHRGANLTVCNVVDHPLNDKVFQFQVTGSGSFETWLNLKNGECKTVDIGVGGFSIYEIVPQEYSIDHISGLDTVNGRGGYLTIQEGDNKTVTFYNNLSQTGFLHGYGSVENKITSDQMPQLSPAQTSSIVFVSSYPTAPETQYMPDIKFAQTNTNYNVIELDERRVIDGSYMEPQGCSYYLCPYGRTRSGNSSITFNNEYRFLGWSTEPQDESHLRGYNFTTEEGKIIVNNQGVPTNLEFGDGDVVYLYAIYDYYHPNNKECAVAEITYYANDIVIHNSHEQVVVPSKAQTGPGYFNYNEFTDKSGLSNNLKANTVKYGYCNDDPDNTFEVIKGEYHEPIRKINNNIVLDATKPTDSQITPTFLINKPNARVSPNFLSINYTFGGWTYYNRDYTRTNNIGNGHYEYEFQIEPISPSSPRYPEWQRFGITNVTSIPAEIIRFAIYDRNQYIEYNYIKTNVYAWYSDPFAA